MKKVLFITMLLCIPFFGFAQEEVKEDNKVEPKDNKSWSFDVTPYLFMAGMKGDVEFLSQSIPVDAEFSDIVDNLSFGIMLHAEANKDKWSFMTDLIYIKLKTDGELLNENIKVEVEIEQLIAELGAGYTVFDLENFNIDAIAGFRYFDLNTVIKTEVLQTRILDQRYSFTDPYIGVRYKTQMNKWKNSARIDIGGFGIGSEFSWKFNVMFGYHISKLMSAHIGYQGYGVDYKKDSFNYDVFTGGPVLGLNFNI